jgi:hypothetical protein
LFFKNCNTVEGFSKSPSPLLADNSTYS